MFDESGRTIDLTWMRTGGQPDTLDGGGSVTATGYTVDFQTDPRFTGVDLAGANFNGTSPIRLRFDPLGAPIGGTDNGTVLIRNADHSILITVDGFTGRVSVR